MTHQGKQIGRLPLLQVSLACALLFTAAPVPAQETEKAAATAEAPAAKLEEKPVELPYRHRPYRVLVSVAFDGDAALTTAFRREVLAGISDAVHRTVGSLWDLTIEENRQLKPARAGRLERLTFADVIRQQGIEILPPDESGPEPTVAQIKESPYEKVFLVTVDAVAARYELAAREWDEATREISATESAHTYDRRDVPATAFRLIRRLFRPILLLDQQKEDSAELWLRAGAFPAADPAAEQLQVGSLIAPFYRYYNKDKIVQRTQYAFWTYLRVEEVDQGWVRCSIISGLRFPLGTGGRRRVDVMGVVLQPQVEATRLKLAGRSKTARPLIGTRVTVEAKTFRDEEPKSEPVEMLTDRQGTLLLKRNPDQPLVWLYIHSGTTLLARLPFLPGVTAEETFQLPDDSQRLFVEGELKQLESRLIDTVARRATYMAFANAHAKKNEVDEVREELDKIDALPGIEEYQTQLTTIRELAIERANAAGNSLAAARIRRMCETVSELINRHLDPAIISEFKNELDDVRASN